MAMRSVTCGRRICTSPYHKGPRWLPISYFHVKEWTPNKTAPLGLLSWCATCQREYTRIKGGHKPRQPAKPRVRKPYKDWTRAEKLKHREKTRLWHAKRRREEGVEARVIGPANGGYYGVYDRGQGRELLPVAQVQVYLNNLIRMGFDILWLEQRTGVSARRLRSIRHGQQRTVLLDTADRIITRTGGSLYLVYGEQELVELSQ